jgi:hypothetical protein
MRAEVRDKAHRVYRIYDEQGFISSTSISQGPKETLREPRVRDMARQLGLDTAQQFIDLVECRLSREAALEIMRRNRPLGTSPRAL